MKALTWYPGTILPFASLWHTLLRATWLNDLRAGDIQQLYMRRKIACKAREARIFARALGEPERALSKFAVWEQFPNGLRSCMTDRLRWCPECMAEGFHTLLGNIRLITRCPIHSLPMLEECPKCHQSFTMRLSSLAVPRRSCLCGRTQFLTLSQARCPTMLANQTEVWEPVAKWVRQVCNMVHSESFVRRIPGNIQLALLARWCHDSGIAYPVCFDDESILWRDAAEAGHWSTYRFSSGCLNDVKSQMTQDLRQDWPAPDQSIVYKAMGRHLRRHGFANPDREIKVLMRTFNPAEFATTMASNQKARVAFVEMLWSRQLEPRAVTRRWPTRPLEVSLSLSAKRKTPIELHESVGRTCFSGGPVISAQGRRWITQHATAIEAQQAWGRASRQTQKSIADGWADWTCDPDHLEVKSFADCVVWICRPKGARIEYLGYVRNADRTPFLIKTPTKQDRCDAFAAVRRHRKEYLDDLASQPCLNWSQRDGWQVEKGALPDDADVRRIVLLHTGLPTQCWIFRSQSLFYARIVDGLIQASGPSAREALCGLRAAGIHYRKTYDANHAAKTPFQPAVQNVTSALAETIRWVQGNAVHMRGSEPERFWSAALITRSLGERCRAKASITDSKD